MQQQKCVAADVLTARERSLYARDFWYIQESNTCNWKMMLRVHVCDTIEHSVFLNMSTFGHPKNPIRPAL